MDFFCEVTGEPTKRFGHIVNIKSLSLYKGFRSLYYFNEDVKAYFVELGRVKGLKDFPVASESLTIDIDNDEEGYKATLEKVKKAGYKFEAWSSGGKGYHIVLFHDWVESNFLPFWHKSWVKTRNIPCDMCIYEHGRLIRLPHTIHAKTGLPKKLLESSEGSLITLNLSEEPPQASFSTQRGDANDDLGFLTIILTKLVDNPIMKGERNRRLFSITKSLQSFGLSESATAEFVEIINDASEEPLEVEELQIIIKSAFR